MKKKDELDTIYRLAYNDVKAKYSNSFLGIIWAFVLPLITILVFWFVFQLGFKNLPVGEAPYILWFSVAYIPWIFFVDITSTGCNCLIEYSYLVKKIKFNVKYIPLIKLISATFIHAFFIVFLFIMCFVYRYSISLYCLQVLYYTGCTCLLGIGITWLLSAVNVFFKDVTALYNVIIQVGFWATPILWNEDTMISHVVKSILTLNPMHYIVNGYRDSFINKQWFWEKPLETILFWCVLLIILIIGKWIFLRLSPFFADEV